MQNLARPMRESLAPAPGLFPQNPEQVGPDAKPGSPEAPPVAASNKHKVNDTDTLWKIASDSLEKKGNEHPSGTGSLEGS